MSGGPDRNLMKRYARQAGSSSGQVHAPSGTGHLALGDFKLTPRAEELHTQVGRIVEELESELAELGKNGDSEGHIQIKKGLVDQYKLLQQRFTPKAGAGSPSFQWIFFPGFFSVPSKYAGCRF